MKLQISHSLEETKKIATDWFNAISSTYSSDSNAGFPPDGNQEAVVVGLSGHLGAGKTAFVKCLAEIMGVKEVVTSPTFTIMKIYETTHPAWPRLVHIDAYRLEKREELSALNWEQLVADPHNLILIEWPENVGLKDFSKDCKLSFEIVDGAYHVNID